MKKKYFIGKGYGSSMQPLINQDDKIYIEKVAFEDLAIGDIIVFYQNNKLISHRFIRKKNGKIIAKGDNSLLFDKPFEPKQIFGRVSKIQGKNDTIDLNLKMAQITKYYFLFYSLIISYAALLTYKILSKIIPGRRFIIKFLKP